MMGSLLTWVLLLLPVFPAKRAAEALFPRAEPLRVLFAALWLYVCLIQTVVIVLGMPGLLTAPWVLGALALVCVASAWLPTPGRRLDALALLGTWWDSAPVAERLAGGALALSVVYAALRLAIDGPFFLFDDWAYHGPMITGMIRSDSVAFYRNNFAMYYAFNPHLLCFYTTLGTGDLQWVWLPTVLWAAIGALAFAVMALAAPRRAVELVLLAGAVTGFSLEFRWFQNAIASTDVIGAVGLFSALALARPRAEADAAEVRANALLCGLVIGYTVGTKVFFAVPCIVAALACVYYSTLGRAGGWGARMALGGQVFCLGLLGTFITGSFWYLYNIVLTGNPVFPVRMFGWDGTVKTKYFRGTTLWYKGEEWGWNGEFWREVWRQWVQWPEIHGWVMNAGLLVGVAMVVIAAWRLVRRRSEGPVPLGLVPMMMLATLILMVAYPRLPYSGTFIGDENIAVQRRYLLVCFMVGMAAWAHLGAAGPRAAMATRVGLWALLVLEWPLVPFHRDYPLLRLDLAGWLAEMRYRVQTDGRLYLDYFGIATALLGLALAAVAVWGRGLGARLAALSQRGATAIVLLGAGLLLLAIVRPMLNDGPYRTFYPRSNTVLLMQVAQAVDHLPADARVGGIGLTMWEQWYIHSSTGHIEPVYLTNLGTPLLELHVAHKRRIIDPDNEEMTQPRIGVPYAASFPDPDGWPARLRAARLDYIIFTKYIPGAWPGQRHVTAEMPDFKLVYGDGYNEIYQFVESPDEPLTVLPAPETLVPPDPWE